MPTKIDWHLPTGITAGEIQWPVPQVLTESDLTTYIYKGTAVLLVPLQLSRDLKPGVLKLKADVSWLECDVQCLPGDGAVEAALTIGHATTPSANALFLTESQLKLPKQGNPIGAKALWAGPPKGDTRALLLEWTAPKAVNNPDFLPYASDSYEIQAPSRRAAADTGKVRISMDAKRISGEWPDKVGGVIVQEVAGVREGYDVSLQVSQAPGSATATSPFQRAGSSLGLGKVLLYAFIGGLILNVMPCVLPVLALKILGFVGQARNEPREARKLGLVYGLGVVLSFLALALLVIAAKAAGQTAGWGFQFGNPYFLIVMTTLVTLIALNLFGVFEIHLGGRTIDTAAKLSSRHGVAGAFFNGLLATVLATSCTAPFLGAAVGFAFTPQPAWRVLLVLGTVGVGLAAPYVLLSWQPGWLKFVPKPGLWMERFKIAVGFPMLAAAIWLFSLASLHYGERSWWLAIFLLFVALAAWIYGEFIQRHETHRGIAALAVLAMLFCGYLFVLESQLQWRKPLGAEARAGQGQIASVSADGVQWQTWSALAVQKARAEGKLVLVDFTAKWCLTCNTIVKPALESASVRQKIQQLNVVPMLADYTGFAKEITEELNRYGRAGVPLVLVFPKDPSAEAIVLPEAVTPGMVVKALDQAASGS